MTSNIDLLTIAEWLQAVAEWNRAVLDTDDGILMSMGGILKGDRFNELTDSKKDKPAKALESSTECKMDPANLHIKTSRGDWCIAKLQKVLLRDWET